MRFRDAELGDILSELLLPWGLEAWRIRTGMFVIRFYLRSPVVGQVLASEGFRTRYRDLVPDMEPVRTRTLERSLTVSEVILHLSLP